MNEVAPCVRVEAYASISPEGELTTVTLPEGMGTKALAYRVDDAKWQACLSAAETRRLSRMQQLGMAAAYLAIRPQGSSLGSDRVGVYVGTGLGTLDHTVEFLDNVIRRDEQLPMPAKFVNSVHNALAAQLAIAFDCRGPNHTFPNDALSFERAWESAAMALQLGDVDRALVVAADAIQPHFVAVGQQHGWWQNTGQALRPMADTPRQDGTLPGEGAGAFVLMRDEADAVPAPRVAVGCQSLSPHGALASDADAAISLLQSVAESAGQSIGDVNLFLLGANGDAGNDRLHARVCEALVRRVGRAMPTDVFKRHCGEFCTASAIGMATALDRLEGNDCGNHVLVYSIATDGHSAFWVER